MRYIADLHVGPRRVGEEYVLELESALGLRRLGTRLGQGVNVERLISEAEDLCGSLLALPSILCVAGDLTRNIGKSSTLRRWTNQP